MRVPGTAALLAAVFLAAPATAQRAQTPPGSTTAPAPPPRPAFHRQGELECRNCHLGKHQAIVQMYIGIGGRGTPTIPSHMLQVRVECIACHATPQPDAGPTGASRTFKPS